MQIINKSANYDSLSPMVSIVLCAHIPTKEYINWLERAVMSLENQTYDSVELVLVLDQCKQEYIDRIVGRLLPNIKTPYITISKPKMQGHGVAINCGMEHARGKYWGVLDADDAFEPAKLEKQVAYMEEHPDLDLCFTANYDYWGNASGEGTKKPGMYHTNMLLDPEEIYKKLPHENVLCHGSVLGKAESFKKMGGVQTQPPGMTDYTTWKVARNQYNMSFYRIPEYLYIWSVGTSVART